MSRSRYVLIGLLALNGLLLVVGAVIGTGVSRQSHGVRVGLVFDVGGLGDKSFNDSAYRGLTRAKDKWGVNVQTIEPGDGSDRESALRLFASQGYELVIGVGFIFTDDITKLAKEFPNTRFACVDYAAAPGTKLADNLSGLRFREHEGSFLVGAIAALTSTSKRVGFVGGMKIPLIRKFEAGFAAGAKHVCPDCSVSSAYAGTDAKAFADPTTGLELALAQFSSGVDVIFHASGKTGQGVFQAARQRKRLAIGVDSDQFHEAPCCVLTSMVKQVDIAVYETVSDVVNDRFRAGVREFGLAEDGVGFVYDDNNRGLLDEGVVARVRALRRKIVHGEIEVPSR